MSAPATETPRWATERRRVYRRRHTCHRGRRINRDRSNDLKHRALAPNHHQKRLAGPSTDRGQRQFVRRQQPSGLWRSLSKTSLERAIICGSHELAPVLKSIFCPECLPARPQGYLATYAIAIKIRTSSIAPAATTARAKRLAAPTFRKVPASPVMVNRSPGRTATKHRTGVWKPLFLRIIFVSRPFVQDGGYYRLLRVFCANRRTSGSGSFKSCRKTSLGASPLDARAARTEGSALPARSFATAVISL